MKSPIFLKFSMLKNNKIIWNHLRKKSFTCYQESFGEYSLVTSPGNVSNGQPIPSNILRPNYALTGKPPPESNISIKSENEILIMRKTCNLARRVLNYLGENISIGASTEDIDHIAHKFMIKNNCYPSPLNYKGFPKSICTSVNNVAVHGIPDDRPLENGDIISVDVTVFKNGFHGDCCETFLMGEVDIKAKKLVNAARKCRDEAIQICGPGVPFKEIGAKIGMIAVEERVTVISCMLGHGIGANFHERPDIYHCENDYPGIMKSGMVFTIEPAIAQGKKDLIIFEDMWTVLMADGGRAAQFEHTILITENGYEILTV